MLAIIRLPSFGVAWIAWIFDPGPARAVLCDKYLQRGPSMSGLILAVLRAECAWRSRQQGGAGFLEPGVGVPIAFPPPRFSYKICFGHFGYYWSFLPLFAHFCSFRLVLQQL